jgi:hypothetical protein
MSVPACILPVRASHFRAAWPDALGGCPIGVKGSLCEDDVEKGSRMGFPKLLPPPFNMGGPDSMYDKDPPPPPPTFEAVVEYCGIADLAREAQKVRLH